MWPMEWHHYGRHLVTLKITLLFESFLSIRHGRTRPNDVRADYHNM